MPEQKLLRAQNCVLIQKGVAPRLEPEGLRSSCSARLDKLPPAWSGTLLYAWAARGATSSPVLVWELARRSLPVGAGAREGPISILSLDISTTAPGDRRAYRRI